MKGDLAVYVHWIRCLILHNSKLASQIASLREKNEKLSDRCQICWKLRHTELAGEAAHGESPLLRTNSNAFTGDFTSDSKSDLQYFSCSHSVYALSVGGGEGLGKLD